MSERAVDELHEIVRRFGVHEGRRAKVELTLVREVFGATDPTIGPGDDAAAIPIDDGFLLLAAEAIWPPLVASDPRAAGVAAVVANVNDVAAMGGRPTAIVDTIVAQRSVAQPILEGLRDAAELYAVPIVGGHLTPRGGAPSLSACILGRARAILPATAVAPGHEILLAACLEGELRADPAVFTSIEARGTALRDDVTILSELAAAGVARAAKDVSMAGLLGSLAMLLEPTRTGARVDLARVPRPEGVPLAEWLGLFPNYAFLITTPSEHVEDVRRPFVDRRLACEVIGRTDDTGVLRVRLGGRTADLIDLTEEAVTGLG